MTIPILYTFRRCPYAMRARMALAYAGINFEVREVVLRNKPDALLEASPKGTVPVLVTHDSRIVDESLDIMHWALDRNDPQSWRDPSFADEINELIQTCDNDFKPQLDRYKYFERHPQKSQLEYRESAEPFLTSLDDRLARNKYLIKESACLADVAIFPFVRQFSKVDWVWFEQAPYPHLRNWLETWMKSQLFAAIMKKYIPWEAQASPVIFNA